MHRSTTLYSHKSHTSMSLCAASVCGTKQKKVGGSDIISSFTKRYEFVIRIEYELLRREL